MSGIPLSEYIRNRRLDRAAFDLQNTDETVGDIALKYGYVDLCQYFGQKKLKYYADFFSSSSSLCCGVI